MMHQGLLTEIRFEADPGCLRSVRSQVRDVLDVAGCPAAPSAQVVIAINEACMNVIQHAYKGNNEGEIILEILNNDGEFEFLLKDFAEPIDCASIKPRALDELRPGGLGTYFIQEIMDNCTYGHLEGAGGNFLRMTKRMIPPRAPSGAEGTALMKYKVRDIKNYAVVELNGDVDLSCSPDARATILNCLKSKRHVLVDLSAVSYIDSSGVASLVEGYQAAKKANLKFGLVGVSEAALSVLQLARLDKVFPIHASVDERLAKDG
jgi:anti-sigma B factor antagonist